MSEVVSVHGNSLQLEHSDEGTIIPRGWGIDYDGDRGELNFLHAAVPTPRRLGDSRVQVTRAYLRFRLVRPEGAVALAPIAEVASLGLWDADRRIYKFDDLGLNFETLGSAWQTRFLDVPPGDPLEYGLGMTVGVKASTFYISISSLGCEFAPFGG